MNWNSCKLGSEFTLGAPQVTRLLHSQPNSRSVAAEPAEPRGHLGRNRYLLGHNPMKCLPRYAKLPGCLTNREPERRKDVLAQNSARMSRPSLGINFHCSPRDHNCLNRATPKNSMILLQVNLPRVAIVPLKRNAPSAVDMNRVALRLTPERMEVEAGNVEISQRRSLLQRI